MSPFEYVSVLISIILGFGITQIVTGVADVIQNWSKTKLYLPHALWVVFVFFLHIQEWWVLFEMRSMTEWKLPLFLFTILYPIGLFVLARLLFPSISDGQELSLKAFYKANFIKFFIAAIILIILSIVDNNVIQSYSLSDQAIQFVLLALLSALVVIKPTQDWVHVTLAVVLLLFLLGSIAFVDWTIAA